MRDPPIPKIQIKYIWLNPHFALPTWNNPVGVLEEIK
jgi:hypothetical protein